MTLNSVITITLLCSLLLQEQPEETHQRSSRGEKKKTK